ncbi:fluoride efflux transporter CrcB [Microvirga brassicacearum]|uniref:fluoride efflux transporter CrcB n=1 Tax=Microvirga brassicacearum TaxID=2580413 RepID=UPI001FCF0194|nr:fluoride efflux transporter CrcB [Microvirga brassicacearum]
MSGYLLVFVGAGLGGCLRYAVNLGTARYWGLAFPWGTLCVNVVGSFLMGTVAAWLAFRSGHTLSHHARLFVATGILGGFTTFSAFSLDTIALWERGDAGLALAYVAGSIVMSIAGLVAGLALVRALA